MSILVVPPVEAGKGGLAVYVPEVQVGYFYPLDSPAAEWQKYPRTDPSGFVTSVEDDFGILLVDSFANVSAGEPLAITVADQDGTRLPLHEFHQRQPVNDPAHPTIRVQNGTSLQLHRREINGSEVTLTDTAEVLRMKIKPCDSGLPNHTHFELSIELDRNVIDIAPLAAFVLSVMQQTPESVEGTFVADLVERMRPQRIALYGCLELARLSELTGNSYRFEKDLCNADLNSIQMHRLLLEGNALRGHITAESELASVRLSAFNATSHQLDQELPYLDLHYHTTGATDEEKAIVWVCAARCESTTRCKLA